MKKKEKANSIAIIGCGVMGGAIATAIAPHRDVVLYDKFFESAQKLADRIGGRAVENLSKVVEGTSLLLLAVKPKDLAALSGQLTGFVRREQVVVSILTGITIHELKRHFRDNHVLRMMPNLPVLYGKGVVALSGRDDFTKELRELVDKTFQPLGELHWIGEEKIDAFTALAGSGPAFALMMIESIVDAGVALGLSAEESKNIATQMFTGSITMLRETGKHPGELKWNITSPGGCTIAGVHSFEEGAVRSGIINTFLATYARIKEIAKGGE